MEATIETHPGNTFTFKIEPDEQGGRIQTVTINRQNIRPIPAKGKGRGKKPQTTSHLLLGFDTEYQPIDVAEQQARVEPNQRNELLSYQFAIKLVTTENLNESQPETEGIIIPDGDNRLSLEEFVKIAVGALIAKAPDIMIPPDIYLIGHFTRADLPAFSDFKDKAQGLMSNVRSTFVSIDAAIPVTVSDEQGHFADLSVRIRDTLLLAPSNAKSLADIGKIVGLPKIELDPDPSRDIEIKENMAIFRRENWVAFRDYAIRDAQVCVKYAETVIRQQYHLFQEFKLPPTLTSIGTQLVLAQWKNDGLVANDLLGREDIKDRHFSKKLGHFIKSNKKPLVENAHFDEAFVTETYHGGRNEQFIFGIAPEGCWRDHDLSSAYTTAMALIGTPNWNEVNRIDSVDRVDPLELAYFSVDFDFPDSVRFPTLPVRTANGIIFPKRGNSKCGAPELELAKRLGAKIHIRRGVKVDSDPSKPIFHGFIKDCIRKRTEFPKGTFNNLFWKEVGNSTYGKTAQGLREKRVYDLRDDDMATLPESQITQPYFASFITSYTRAVLGEILNGFSTDVSVFSVTTDGFLSNASDKEIANATSGPLFRSFADARNELDRNDAPLEVKHVVRQPIGWRTRGSATLQVGEPDNGIVLQKGGMKTNSLFNLAQENAFTVHQFLDRTPESMIPYKTAVGLKDMVRLDTDLVFMSVTKRLSMEFDWKRRPVEACDVPFVFEGKNYTHLTFETEPINDVAEFSKARDAWEQFDKKPRKNLKSLWDLNRFLNYLRTSSDPEREATKYLKKDDGDLKRLRRDLTRAFKQLHAGFDIERGKRRITNEEFRRALVDSGIPCSIADVDNGNKGLFKPHQTFATGRVLEAAARLKRNHYPDLVLKELFPPGFDFQVQDTENPQKSDFDIAA